MLSLAASSVCIAITTLLLIYVSYSSLKDAFKISSYFILLFLGAAAFILAYFIDSLFVDNTVFILTIIVVLAQLLYTVVVSKVSDSQ